MNEKTGQIEDHITSDWGHFGIHGGNPLCFRYWGIWMKENDEWSYCKYCKNEYFWKRTGYKHFCTKCSNLLSEIWIPGLFPPSGIYQYGYNDRPNNYHRLRMYSLPTPTRGMFVPLDYLRQIHHPLPKLSSKSSLQIIHNLLREDEEDTPPREKVEKISSESEDLD